MNTNTRTNHHGGAEVSSIRRFTRILIADGVTIKEFAPYVYDFDFGTAPAEKRVPDILNALLLAARKLGAAVTMIRPAKGLHADYLVKVTDPASVHIDRVLAAHA